MGGSTTARTTGGAGLGAWLERFSGSELGRGTLLIRLASGAWLGRNACIPAAGVSERSGAVLGRVARSPVAGVSDRGDVEGRDGPSPATTGVPLIGVSVREDGGGGRVDGECVADVPLDSGIERGTLLGRTGSVPAMGVPLAGVSLRGGGLLGREAAVGVTLECTAGMPLAGVKERCGGALGRKAAVGATLGRVAGVPLVGVTVRCGVVLGRKAAVGATLGRVAGVPLAGVTVRCGVVLGRDVEVGTTLGTTAGALLAEVLAELCLSLVPDSAFAATAAVDFAFAAAGAATDVTGSGLAGGTDAEIGVALETASSAPQSSSMSSVLGISD